MCSKCGTRPLENPYKKQRVSRLASNDKPSENTQETTCHEIQQVPAAHEKTRRDDAFVPEMRAAHAHVEQQYNLLQNTTNHVNRQLLYIHGKVKRGFARDAVSGPESKFCSESEARDTAILLYIVPTTPYGTIQ